MIVGELIDLRPIVEEDLDRLEAWLAEPEYAGPFNTIGLTRPGTFRAGFARDGLLTDDRGTLLIVTKAGEFAGDISYRSVSFGGNRGNNCYELGITVAAARRGRGYGTEAQRLLAAFLFATYPIARVQASTDRENIGEQRSLERAGFTREGTMRQAQFRAGAWHDMIMYSKLRDE
jgi:RimJ/RimL family protein N-acetyltransferase